MSMKNHGGMISTGETPDSSTRALWEFYRTSHLVTKQEEIAKEMNFAYEISVSYT
jgi:hypothetical protein